MEVRAHEPLLILCSSILLIDSMQYLTGVTFGVAALFGQGFGNVAIALASKKYGSTKTAFLFFLMAVAILVIPAFFLFSFSGITAYDALLMLMTGFIAVIGMISYVKGFEVGNVSVVAPITNGWGVVTVILSIAFLNARLNPVNIMEVLLIVVGVVLVSLKYKDIKKLKLNKIGKGVNYALVTMVAMGLYFFLDAIIVSEVGWFDALFILDLAIMVMIFCYGHLKKTKLALSAKGGYLILLLGALANVFGSISYNLGVTYNSAAIIAPIASVAVMLPIVYGIFFLKEKLERTQILGMALIILSIIALSI